MLKDSTRAMLERSKGRNENMPRCLKRMRKAMAASIWQKRLTGKYRLSPLWS